MNTANIAWNAWHQYRTRHGRQDPFLFTVTHTLTVWQQVWRTVVILRARTVGTATANVFGLLPGFLITPCSRFSWLTLNPAHRTAPAVKNCTFSVHQRANSDYFPIQHWLFYITEIKCVYCAVRTGYLCFVWIWEQTAIISLYSINWLIFIIEIKSAYYAVRTGSLNKANCTSFLKGKCTLYSAHAVMCLTHCCHNKQRYLKEHY
jgi:hypothetical protein